MKQKYRLVAVCDLEPARRKEVKEKGNNLSETQKTRVWRVGWKRRQKRKTFQRSEEEGEEGFPKTADERRRKDRETDPQDWRGRVASTHDLSLREMYTAPVMFINFKAQRTSVGVWKVVGLAGFPRSA